MMSLASVRLNGVARVLGLACVVAVLGLVCGRIAISHYGVPALEVLVAVPILALLIPRPLAACTLLLALLCSAPFYTWLPRLNVPGHPPINVGDVLLLAIVGSTLWRRPWRSWPSGARRGYLAVGLLLMLALIPTIVHAGHGHDAARESITGYKDLLYMLLGLTVALELSGRLWTRTVNIAMVIATVVAILSILAAASGGIASALASLDAQSVVNAAADTTVGTTSRIRLPGLFLIYAMTIPTLVMVLLVKDKWRPLRAGALLLMISAIAVSLNRNMYLGGAVGLAVTLLVGGPRLRHRVLIVAVTLAAILALVVQSAVLPAVAGEVTQRAQSALTPQVLSSSSITTRTDEFAHALTSIEQHPLLGIGWYANYGAFVGPDQPRPYVEDWYLDLTTDLGVPVTVMFMVASLFLVYYGIAAARRARGSLDRAMAAAGVGTLIALLLSCLVGTYLQDPNSMTAFGFGCGFLVAAGLRAAGGSQDATVQPG